AEYVYERESCVPDAVLDQLCQMFWLPAETASHIGGARRERQQDRVYRPFDIAERRALRFHSRSAGRRDLPRGQPIDLVVHRNICEVHIAPHRVDEMVSADA